MSDTSPLNYLVLIDLQHILPELFVDPKLQHLGRGEREAITLAASLAAGSVLIDERKGRLVARECSLAVSGTLGVLDLAARRGLANLSEALRRLDGTTFRVSPRLIRLMNAREPESRGQG